MPPLQSRSPTVVSTLSKRNVSTKTGDTPELVESIMGGELERVRLDATGKALLRDGRTIAHVMDQDRHCERYRHYEHISDPPMV